MRADLIRNELTTEWQERGATEGPQFAILTNTIHEGTFALAVAAHKDYKSLRKRDNPRDAESAIARLRARLQEMLAPDEVALAQAFIPAWFEYGPRQAQLLAVTATRMLLLAERDPHLDQVYSLKQISSLELRASILGSWLALWMPDHGTMRRVEIPFPSTSFGFQTCYRMLRQVMANPLARSKEVAACASPS